MSIFNLKGLDYHLVRSSQNGRYKEIAAIACSESLVIAAMEYGRQRESTYDYEVAYKSGLPLDEDDMPFMATRRENSGKGSMEIIGASLNMLMAKAMYAASLDIYPATDKLAWQHGIRQILTRESEG